MKKWNKHVSISRLFYTFQIHRLKFYVLWRHEPCFCSKIVSHSLAFQVGQPTYPGLPETSMFLSAENSTTQEPLQTQTIMIFAHPTFQWYSMEGEVTKPALGHLDSSAEKVFFVWNFRVILLISLGFSVIIENLR